MDADIRMDSFMTSTPSTQNSVSTSSIFSSRFRKMNLEANKENQKQPEIPKTSTGIEKPKKKKEKYKPTNLAHLIANPPVATHSPPRNKKESQLNDDFEITCSGSFLYHDLKITGNGIACFPPSLSMSQSLSDHSMDMSLSQNKLMLSPPRLSQPMETRKTPPIKRHVKRRISFDNLQEERQLGTGASSAVFLVRDSSTGHFYARKSIVIGRDVQPKVVIQEIKALYVEYHFVAK
jgi:hypothetical protein